ncbi:BrxA family protein [Solidesulfovibrio alcoholivorans]|uniref:BrxA family protein n=1 Tax=Solidesulfovibrio alcoholivorans TaxID=81406 RepID=UPI003CCB99E1
MDNVLQKRSPATTRRQSKRIRNRLLPLHEDSWIMIRDGSHEQTEQAVQTHIKMVHSEEMGTSIVGLIEWDDV